MQNYEITYLTIEEDNDKNVAKLITEHEGKIVAEESLGKKRLSYKIKKQEFAYIYTIRFQISASGIVSVNRLVQDNNDILRHLIVSRKILTSIPDTSDRNYEKDSKKIVKKEKVEEPIIEESKEIEKEEITKTIDKKVKEKVKEIKSEDTKKAKKVAEKPEKKKTKSAKSTTENTKARLDALDEKLNEILKD